MSNLLSTISVTGAAGKVFSATDTDAFMIARCSNCDGTQMSVVAKNDLRCWLVCLNCHRGHVGNRSSTGYSFSISPGRAPLATPGGLPSPEGAIWEEIRNCLGIGAYTSAVMMCRKLLLHLAVANGLGAKDAKGFAPSFAAAVAHLETEGVITVRMRPWVDRIKDVGNEANHELIPVDGETALDVARFTEQLLRLSFEMDSLVAAAKDEGDDIDEGGDGDAAHVLRF